MSTNSLDWWITYEPILNYTIVFCIRETQCVSNRILTWLTANPPGFGPKTHQPGGFEFVDKPGAQLVGFEQATTINTLKIGKYT